MYSVRGPARVGCGHCHVLSISGGSLWAAGVLLTPSVLLSPILIRGVPLKHSTGGVRVGDIITNATGEKRFP